eukprot:GFYU01006571.1.p1 GENE.GFYU01006571.1~~GFYU01006571.1.p1  ORF type:complete len:696 (-),score=109.29 GFYU01006571.1:83-2170(-)
MARVAGGTSRVPPGVFYVVVWMCLMFMTQAWTMNKSAEETGEQLSKEALESHAKKNLDFFNAMPYPDLDSEEIDSEAPNRSPLPNREHAPRTSVMNSAHSPRATHGDSDEEPRRFRSRRPKPIVRPTDNDEMTMIQRQQSRLRDRDPTRFIPPQRPLTDIEDMVGFNPGQLRPAMTPKYGAITLHQHRRSGWTPSSGIEMDEPTPLSNSPSAKLARSVADTNVEQHYNKRVRSTTHDIKVMQYNLLAFYLADNTKPWLMYGVPRMNARRGKVFKAYGKAKRSFTALLESRGETIKTTTLDWNKYWESNMGDFLTDVLSEHEIDILKGRAGRRRGSGINKYDTDAAFSAARRMRRFRSEIHVENPDILTLAELDVDFISEFEVNKLGRKVYDSYTKPRGPGIKDGSGVFWKLDRFSFIKGEVLYYTTDALKEFDPLAVDNEHCAVLVTLFDKVTRTRLVVIATHLFKKPTDPLCERARLASVKLLDEHMKKDPHYHNTGIIFGSDMNAKPAFQQENLEKWDEEGVPPGAAVTYMAEQFGPGNAGLVSAFDPHVVWSTSRTVDRPGPNTIDWIFFSNGKFSLVDTNSEYLVNELPRLCQKDESGDLISCIPDKFHPSDHVPIIATLTPKMIIEYEDRERELEHQFHPRFTDPVVRRQQVNEEREIAENQMGQNIAEMFAPEEPPRRKRAKVPVSIEW